MEFGLFLKLAIPTVLQWLLYYINKPENLATDR